MPLTQRDKVAITKLRGRGKASAEIARLLNLPEEEVGAYTPATIHGKNDGGVATKTAKKAVTLPKRA